MARRFGSIQTARGLESGRALIAAQEITRSIIDDWARQMESAFAAGRRLSFEQTQEVYRRATAAVARAEGVGASTFGRILVPDVRLANAFDGVGGAPTWRTILRARGANAAEEAATIMRLGMLEGAHPTELARRMRFYVQGSESFTSLFETVPTLTGEVSKIDLRKVPLSVRKGAANMRLNAERIAFTEYGHARHEVELQHAIQDPFIEAARWETSPDRGRGQVPDECDWLRDADFFELGPGIYPVDQIPALPHPFDRCEISMVRRSAADIEKAKPTGTFAATEPPFDTSGMTENRVRRMEKQANRSIGIGRGVLESVLSGASPVRASDVL